MQEALKIQEHPAPTGKGFDLRTHITDAKTGQLIRFQPYTLRVRGNLKYYERPKGSGNLFWENGEPAGRFIAGEVDPKATHIAAQAPRLPAERMSELEEKNAALEAELSALKAEREAKAAEAAKPKTPAQK